MQSGVVAVSNLQGIVQTFGRYRYLLGNLIRRDFKVKYRRSVLGVLWSVLNPLLMMLIMTAVFSFIFRQNLPYFPVYLFSGQLLFNFFSDATNTAMDSVMSNAPLIKKVYIPKYIFPLQKATFSLVNAGFSLIAFVPVLIQQRPPITAWILFYPVVMLILCVFNFGVGMALSALVVLFRDIKHLYAVLMVGLTYATPLFYPESLLPATMQMLIKINPLYWFVSMGRQVVMGPILQKEVGGEMVSYVLGGTAPTLLQLGMTCGWALLALVAGLWIFRKLQDRFILYV